MSSATIDSPRSKILNSLTPAQVASYEKDGFLHIPGMFPADETEELLTDLNWMIDEWATKDAGWSGPWRKKYMDAETEKKSKLIALHDLQYYSSAWMRAVTNRKLVGAMADLLGPVVEFHHSTLHVKPPESGHPFPMHQDYAFYQHADDRYVDVLVHLDDTEHKNGEIRFLAGSHKLGVLPHIVKDEDGKGCTPHLSFDEYKLEDTVAVPAKGDVVLFNILTIHGSYINTTSDHRRLVRVGYRAYDNAQLEGQSKGRPGWMVWGRRPRREGDMAFPLR